MVHYNELADQGYRESRTKILSLNKRKDNTYPIEIIKNSTGQIWNNIKVNDTLRKTFDFISNEIDTGNYLSPKNFRFIKSHLLYSDKSFLPIVKLPKKIKSLMFTTDESLF